MSKIFISYRRDDSADTAERIVEHLTELSGKFSIDDLFFDVDSIPPGINFRKYISERVSQCTLMLVVIGPDWVTIKRDDGTRRLDEPGDYVRLEVEAALSRGIPLIPVLVRNATMPRLVDLPDSLRELPDYSGLMVRRAPDFESDMARLIAAVERYVPGKSAANPTPAPAVIARPSSLDLFKGTPFAWIDIPGSKGKNWRGDPYKIGKYPVTNAQYKRFIDAGGYATQKWWTPKGWQKRGEGRDGLEDNWKASGMSWIEPRFWRDPKWNGAEQPVVGVSWFEAVAFCLWLSETTDENIMLPTEDHWQYAAQGDDGRVYPWGNKGDQTHCNTCESAIGKTTPVRQYEGKGDSPFGVVDMAGNVWEWCRTDYASKSNDMHTTSSVGRVVRGGGWIEFLHYARIDLRDFGFSITRNKFVGFRCARF